MSLPKYPVGTVCRVHAGWWSRPEDNKCHGRLVRITRVLSSTGVSHVMYEHVCIADPSHEGKGVGQVDQNSECYLIPVTVGSDMEEL